MEYSIPGNYATVSVNLTNIEMAWWKPVGTWQRIDADVSRNHDENLLADFLTWREEFNMPLEWYALAHSGGGRMLPINARLFRKLMYDRFSADIDAYAHEMEVPAKSWSMVTPPPDQLGFSRRYRPKLEGIHVPYRELKGSRPLRDRVIFNLDGVFWRRYLVPKYGHDIQQYNREHDTDYSIYHEIFLSRRAPQSGLAKDDWEQFVRDELNLNFIRLDSSLAKAYRLWLSNHYKNISNLNTRYSTSYVSFRDVPFSTEVPPSVSVQVDWEMFVKDRQACPLEAIEVYGPRQAFEEYVARRRGLPLEKVTPLIMPVASADYHDAMQHKSQLRWEFILRNYKHVMDFIWLHGHGIRNTLIYCLLAVSTALLVNPLAAYALSRYKLPKTYTILLFFMVTMAFPAEVTMIPNFLLLKRFPLWPLLSGGAIFFLALWLLGKFKSRWPEQLRMLSALGCGLFVGVWLVPYVILAKPTTSLLNTFAALILPGMANGYFIFILKGFFDSIPKELFEAADLDGASEWTKFWLITMNLSKPVLAVIALGAFTGAYSAFMMALVIIPDPDMWTLMVWLYQLQSESHQAVVYAALVIAAVPTFIVFVLCQNVIMRGIVVPVEK
ncbi:MAG: ABC transporter permease subunit [Actinobacteria bacterium]|nr:ABC transporter permease subunit [Actinomycetota bacterium]